MGEGKRYLKECLQPKKTVLNNIRRYFELDGPELKWMVIGLTVDGPQCIDQVSDLAKHENLPE